MNQWAFDAQLRREVPRAILLYGDNPFLVNYYGETVVRLLNLGSEEKNSFYFSEYNFNSVREILSQGSLFGGCSFVRLKINKTIAKDEIENLLKTLEKNSIARLLVEFYEAPNRRIGEYARESKALAEFFSTESRGAKEEQKKRARAIGAVEVRFFPFTLETGMTMLRNRAKELALDVGDYWLRELLELQNGDVGLAYGELDKFTILGRVPDIKDIEQLSYGLGGVGVDEICEAMIDKRDSLKLAISLDECGVKDMDLISGIEKYFHQLFLFFAHIRIYGRPNDTKDILGYALPKALADKRMALAIRLKEGHFFKIFTLLQEWRADILQGRSEGRGALLALIKIQEILK